MADERVLATNRKASHDYHILDRYEAGLALVGTEVKSLREGRANLKEAYCRIRAGEAFLIGCHISPYSHGNVMNHEPARDRKLLLHGREIRKLDREVQRAGSTIVPLKFYLKDGRIKLEIALAKGKKNYDKRESAKRKAAKREAAEAVGRRR